ncbi:MAG: hypothetical protein PVH68_01385 [Armatimonadota bacterium]
MKREISPVVTVVVLIVVIAIVFLAWYLFYGKKTTGDAPTVGDDISPDVGGDEAPLGPGPGVEEPPSEAGPGGIEPPDEPFGDEGPGAMPAPAEDADLPAPPGD